MEAFLKIGHFLFILLEIILVFNLMVVVHELGHFLAARWRGLQVDKFQVWFGKPIWKKTINGVQYGLGFIPAGGFVALPQMAPMEMLEGKREGDGEHASPPLPPISALDKIIVAFAGPLFSFGLACVFALLVFWVGRPVSSSETTAVIGYIEKDSPAEQAGLLSGDKVLEIDGKKIRGFRGMIDSVMERVILSEGEKIQFLIERPGESAPITVDVGYERGEAAFYKRPDVRRVGIHPLTIPQVGEVVKHSPAEQAGIKAGDIIQSIDGTPYYHPIGISDYVEAHADKDLNIVLLRHQGTPEETTVTLKLKPEKPLQPQHIGPKIGIIWDFFGDVDLAHPSPAMQIKDSTLVLFRTLGAIFSPSSDISAKHLSGPIGIGNHYYRIFTSNYAWHLAIWFSVILNINLAILNLLPLPVLDGGHITIALLEGIRKRPVSVRFLEFVQTACALFLIGFMLYVTVFDVQDLGIFQKQSSEGSGEIIFAEPTSASPQAP